MIDDATIKKIARECWPGLPDHWWDKKDGAVWKATSTFARACYSAGQQEQKNKAAEYIMSKGFATGHGDTINDLLDELVGQAQEAQRVSDVKICEAIAEKIPVFDGEMTEGGAIAYAVVCDAANSIKLNKEP